MRRALKRHPESICAAVAALEVEAVRIQGGLLSLRYVLTGRIADLRLPPPVDPTRTDELWRHSCFEAFLRPCPGDAYCEFNLAPSTQWAAYRFDSYRQGMRTAEVAGPRIETLVSGDHLELRAELALDPASTAPWRLGLSAVIEEANGRISYWALAHHPGKPDFHHADGFALDLPSPERR